MSDAAAENAVHRLTEEWTDVVAPINAGDKYKAITHEPLLVMLRQAVSSGLRAGSSPSPTNDVGIINLKALELQERIDGWVRAFARDSGLEHKGELAGVASALLVRIEALWSSGNLTESVYLGVTSGFVGFADEIWGMFHPPVVKELAGECPECGARYIVKDGDRQSALVARYWSGVRPEAECRSCNRKWSGERELLELGYSIKANVDHEVLKDLGLIA